MNRQKVLKLITVFLCALLALVMVLTMLLPLMAAEDEGESRFRTEDPDETGVIVDMQTDNLVEELRQYSFYCVIHEITEGDATGIYEGFLDNGTYENLHIYALYSTSLYSDCETEISGTAYPADTAFSPAIFENATTHYLPYSEEYGDYAGLCVMVYDYINYAFTMPDYDIVKIDGQKYISVNAELWAYIAVCCETDEAGELIPLKFWEKGFIGTLWDMRLLLALVLIGAALVLLFFRSPKPQKAQGSSAPATADGGEKASDAGGENALKPENKKHSRGKKKNTDDGEDAQAEAE